MHHQHVASFPPVSTAYPAPVRNSIVALETTLVACHQDRILLLLEDMDAAMKRALSLACVERLLRYGEYRWVLLLIPPQLKQTFLEAWETRTSLEDGQRLAGCFSATCTPTRAADTHVCITTVQEIQMQIGLDRPHAFFEAFDAVVIHEVPPHPGPGWTRSIELLTAHARILGFSSTLTKEEGEHFFGEVVTAKEKEYL